MSYDLTVKEAGGREMKTSRLAEGEGIRPFKLKTIAFMLGIFLSGPFDGAAAAIKRIGGGIAQPLDILCGKSQVFMADVLEASSRDCRRQHPSPGGCTPTDVLHLSLMVGEMLATDGQDQSHSFGRNLRSGDSIEVVTIVVNRLPRMIEGTASWEPGDEYGQLKVTPPTGQSLSDDEISALLVGKKFIFGISLNEWSRPSDTLYANIWPLTLDRWVRENIRERTNRACLRLTPQGSGDPG